MSEVIPIIPTEITKNGTETSQKASNIIRKFSLLTTGAGLIPILGLDVGIVTTLQASMVKRLANLYEVEYASQQVRVILTSFTTSVVARVAAMGVRKVFNSFSTFGHLADEMTNAALSGFITAASGEIYKIHFENGGTIDNLDAGKFFDYFKAQVEQGTLSPKTFTGLGGFSYLRRKN